MLERYKKYKTTNYDWLPQIPSHWDKKTIRSITKLSDKRCGLRNDLELLSVYREYGVIKKKSRDDNHNVESENLSNYKYVKKGNLVLNKMKMWQGSLGISDYDGIVSPAYIVCDLFTNANLKYLQFLLRSPLLKTFYNRVTYGIRVGQWDMHYDDFKSLCLYFPPCPEQDQIVRYLDWKVSMINKYINAKKKQIELLKEHFSKKVTDLLFKDVTSFLKMKHLTEYKLQYGANASGIDFTDKYPRYIRITDINNDGTLSTDNVLSLNISNYNDYLLKDGDILFARSGATVGKSFMYKDEYGKCCFAGYLICIIPNKKIILPEYLYYYTLSSNYNKWLKQVFIQTTIQNVSAEKYKELIIPYIPLEKQTKLVSRINFELEKNKNIIKNIIKTINFLQEYRTRLISDVVTGKVNIQNVKVPEFENIDVPDVLDSGEGEEEGINGDN